MRHYASMIRSGAWSGLAGAGLQGLRSAVYTFLSARLEDREPVILSPFAVILSAAKDLGISLRANLAKNPGICFRGRCDEGHGAS